MSSEGYRSLTDVSRVLGGLLLHFLLLDNQVKNENTDETQTDGQERRARRKGGNGERRSVKAGALKVILAGN